jgi:hypothetical protein
MQLRKNNISTAIFWNEVKFDKCLHSTKKLSNIKSVKNNFRTQSKFKQVQI